MMDKFLVIGLGSMGKRRIRCLLSLGIKKDNIYGLDVRGDRRQEAQNKYGIYVVSKEEGIDFTDIKAVIVSLPPDKHFYGVKIAVDHDTPVFVEASVVLQDVEQIRDYNNGKVFIAPSCTMNFHPMIKEIKRIIENNSLGKVCNFSYHSGQFLPDWHPWENVKDFYVSNRETGGAREIVPFELTWLTKIFGKPLDVKGYFRKTAEIGCDIEDSYACVLDYGDMIGTMLVDVVARYAVRSLIINCQKGQIQWDWNSKRIGIYLSDKEEWKYIEQTNIKSEAGYNENLDENMYIEEIASFLQGADNYLNTIDDDINVLKLLMKLEESDGGF